MRVCGVEFNSYAAYDALPRGFRIWKILPQQTLTVHFDTHTYKPLINYIISHNGYVVNDISRKISRFLALYSNNNKTRLNCAK